MPKIFGAGQSPDPDWWDEVENPIEVQGFDWQRWVNDVWNWVDADLDYDDKRWIEAQRRRTWIENVQSPEEYLRACSNGTKRFFEDREYTSVSSADIAEAIVNDDLEGKDFDYIDVLMTMLDEETKVLYGVPFETGFVPTLIPPYGGQFPIQNPVRVRLPYTVPHQDRYRAPYVYEEMSGTMREQSKVLYKQQELLARFREQVAKKNGFREGSIEINGDVVTISLGIRRCKDFSEDDVSKGSYLYGISYGKEVPHTLAYLTTSFYGNLVYPHLVQQDVKDPMEWCIQRMELVTGFVYKIRTNGEGRYNFRNGEFAFGKMAELACNLRPPEIDRQRKYQIDDGVHSFIDDLENELPEAYCPEMLCFFFEIYGYFEELNLEDGNLLVLLGEFRSFLENGLIVDRLIVFFKQSVDKGMSPEQALVFVLEVVGFIYGGEAKPWWFKEDIDFCDLFERFDSEERLLISGLAEASGFAFQYALPVYREKGYELEDVEGLGRGVAIDITVRVVEAYGIGNTYRACNILQFFIDAVATIDVSERAGFAELFLDHIESKKPWSHLTGAMEGADATIHFPGLHALFRHGEIAQGGGQPGRYDDANLDFAAINSFAEFAALPLSHRGLQAPLLALGLEKKGALAEFAGREQKLLPASTGDGVALANPSVSVFNFYKRLRAECEINDPDHVAEVYFNFLAQKMPNPLDPPFGLLRCIDRYLSIPNHAYLHAMYFAPEDRRQRSVENQHHIADRYMFLSNLMDFCLVGFFTLDKFMEVLNWLTVEAIDGVSISEDERDYEFARREGEHRLDRLVATDSAMRMFLALQVFVAGGLVSGNAFKTLCGDMVGYFKQAGELGLGVAEYRKEFDPFRRSERNGDLEDENFSLKDEVIRGEELSYGIEVFAEILELEIIDPDKFNSVVSGKSLDQVWSLMQEMRYLVKKYHISKKMIDLASELASRGRYSKRRFGGYFDGVNVDAEACINELIELWEDVPAYVNESAVDLLLVNFAKVDLTSYYAKALGVLRTELRKDVRDSVSVITGQSDSFDDYVSVTAMSTSLVAMLVAGRRENLPGTVRLALTDGLSSTGASKRARSAAVVSSISDAASRMALELAGKMEPHVPEAREIIRQVRLPHLGFLPVGGKIHVLHAVDADYFERVRRMLGLGSTAFRLIHAGRSVLLPPTPSSQEFKMVYGALSNLGLIDTERPELQVALPGRLNLRNSAILGSAVLLGTRAEDFLEYPPGAFKTTHGSDTLHRFMTHDAGVQNIQMPFMSSIIEGRTDVMARRDPVDAELIQLVGSVLVQGQYDEGPFKDLAEEYIRRHEEILNGHGLLWILDKPWLLPYEERGKIEGPTDYLDREHYELIKSCTDAYRECASRYKETRLEKGVVFEMQALEDWLLVEVRKIQRATYDPQNPCQDMRMLLDF